MPTTEGTTAIGEGIHDRVPANDIMTSMVVLITMTACKMTAFVCLIRISVEDLAVVMMNRATRILGVATTDEDRDPTPTMNTIDLVDAGIGFQSSLLNSALLSAEDFTDIRIPNSRSRRAFVQFQTVNHAIRFVDRHFPELTIEPQVPENPPGSGRVVLYVHFARSRDEGDRRQPPSEQWMCPSCDFSNYATRMRCKMCGFAQSSSMESGYKQLLTGETDASNDPSQFIVIYPLDPCVTEEVLEFGIKKLEIAEKQPTSKDTGASTKLKSTAPTGDVSGYGARRGSLHRVFLIRDKSDSQSLKYGFAEFWTLEDAAAALAKFRMSRNFTIGGTAVNIFSIHMGVFVPELQQPPPEEARFSFVPLFNPALRVKYWDPHVFANQRVVNAEPPAKTGPAAETPSSNADSKKSKKRKADGSLSSGASKKPVAMAGQMAMWQRKHEELRVDGSIGSSNEGASGTESGDTGRQSNQTPTAPGKEKQGPIKISLSGLAAPIPQTDEREGASPEPTAACSDTPVSYVDRDRVCCLLCMMKYKSLDDLETHERSGNHKRAMADEEKVKAAAPRLAARDKRLQEQGKMNDNGKSQYRDRAKERREAFNQPKKPAPQPTKQKPPKPEGLPSTTPAPPAAPAPSKGSAMLAKMGWTGQGLGANGEGRTEIIVTNAYQEGVGLGAEGGNLGDAAELAQRKTKNNYTEYLTTAQEKARERYNQLN
ncbi:hypothetical protein jhhlp_004171 [Lomentospora prolificans]|uniref:G-patch domain-containing protein n=1 Tax=Lomentospora prolificans TaxID=41688 RepID=A0A2N3NAV7_9PEZI|nr:hypothetical protein jhhlp_004171 [Lomentospora prolificans]